MKEMESVRYKSKGRLWHRREVLKKVFSPVRAQLPKQIRQHRRERAGRKRKTKGGSEKRKKIKASVCGSASVERSEDLPLLRRIGNIAQFFQEKIKKSVDFLQPI